MMPKIVAHKKSDLATNDRLSLGNQKAVRRAKKVGTFHIFELLFRATGHSASWSTNC